MCALRDPVQLRGCHALEQLDVREQIAGIVFLEFSHCEHILLPLLLFPLCHWERWEEGSRS